MGWVVLCIIGSAFSVLEPNGWVSFFSLKRMDELTVNVSPFSYPFLMITRLHLRHPISISVPHRASSIPETSTNGERTRPTTLVRCFWLSSQVAVRCVLKVWTTNKYVQ